MDKQTIVFRADDQTLVKLTGADKFASNIVSYIDASFDLGNNWGAFDAVRAVWVSGTNKIATVLHPDTNSCKVPAEILRHPSRVLVNLIGSTSVDGELQDRLTTYPVLAFTINKDVKLAGNETPKVTPSQFEQYVSYVREYWEDMQDYKSDAEAWAIGKRAGADVEPEDPTYDNNSKYYAERAREYVEDLETTIIEHVDNWLDEHPEATTTVQDDSLTTAKYKDKSVTTAKVGDGAITANQISDKAVTEAKLADAVSGKINTNVENVASLTTRMGTAESDIATLDSRVDQIVAPTGEAPSAAEVTDARVGADGVTYTSLGTANRTQFTDLKSDISHISESENLFSNTAEEVYEFSIVYTNGSIISNSGARTICVPCKPNTQYCVKKRAGGRFVVGDLPAKPVAGNTCTQYYADNTASSIYYTTSGSAKYLVAFVYYNATDGADYTTMLASVVVNEVSAKDYIARATTQKVENGYGIYNYNADVSLLTNSGSGRYIIGHAFPAGYIDSVFVDVAASSEVEVRLYTLDDGVLNVAFYTTGASVSAGMLEIPIKKNALNPFYIMINRISGGIMYRSNSACDVYGVSAAESYTLASLNASHYEFGISVKYGLFRDYTPLGKNYLLIGDSYLEGYSADGNVVSWGERLKSCMGLEYNTVIKYKGGIGFIEGTGTLEGYSFKSLALNANVPDPNTITHIVVCGGYNDAVRSLSQGEVGILNAIEDFYDNVSPVYPNANIYIGMIGYRNNDDAVLSRIRGAGLSAYQTANRYGANEKIRYLNNVEWTLVSNDMSSDGYHPNGVGQIKLAWNIKNALLTGSAPIRTFARDND